MLIKNPKKIQNLFQYPFLLLFYFSSPFFSMSFTNYKIMDVSFPASYARQILNLKKDEFDKTMHIIRILINDSIREASFRGNGQIRFTIPTFIFNRPNYNPSEMGKALANQLHEEGYKILGNSLCLHIIWNHETDAFPSSYSSSSSSNTRRNSKNTKSKYTNPIFKIDTSYIKK
jgi:hypothetical protein